MSSRTGRGRVGRRLGLVGVVAGVLAAGVPATAVAASTPTLTVRSDISGAGSPGRVTVRDTLSVWGGTLDAATFTASVPQAFSIDPSTVELQGKAPDPATVTAKAHSVVLRLGSGADANAAGALGPAAYLVTYEVAVPGSDAIPAPASASTARAELAGTEGAATATVSLAPPLLIGESAYPPGVRLPLAPGGGNVLPLMVRDRGATADSSTMHVRLSAGLGHPVVEVSSMLPANSPGAYPGVADGVVPCHPEPAASGKGWACDTGVLLHGTPMAAFISFAELRPVALHVPRHVRAWMTAENAVATVRSPEWRGRFVDDGAAWLGIRIRPDVSQAHVGDLVHLRITLHNAGPQPTGPVAALISADPGYLHVVSLTGRQTTRNIPRPIRLGPGVRVLLPISLDPGETRTQLLTVRATAPGRARFAALAVERARNPCMKNAPGAGCQAEVNDHVKVVGATAAAAPSAATTTLSGMTSDQGLRALGKQVRSRLLAGS